MAPLRAKITSLILFVFQFLPWPISRLIRQVGKVPDWGESDEIKNFHTASLFEGQVKWKGISFVGVIGRSDLEKIHDWMNSQAGSRHHYYDGHEKAIYSTNLVDSGINNLGYVSFGRRGFFAVSGIRAGVRLPKGCYVTLLRLKNGLSYLSLYVVFNESVEKKVSKIDVKHVRRYKSFRSFNPFSPQFFALEFHDRQMAVKDLVYKKARNVVSEANQAVSTLLHYWGVRKDISDFSTAADFFRNGTGSYFDSVAMSEVVGQSNLAVMTSEKGSFRCAPITEDVSEEYMEGYISEKIGVNAIFVKSEVSSDVGEAISYGHTLVGVSDYYSYMLMLVDIYSQFKQCMSKVSPIFFNYKSGVRADLTILLNANLALNIIDERLTAVEEGLHWSDKKYHEYIRYRLLEIRARVVALRADVEKRKKLNDSALQLTNLFWMKRYSILIFFLAIIQIVLAVLNVDWRTEEGRSKNPIYINLFSDKK
jgi:hypothetical protein